MQRIYGAIFMCTCNCLGRLFSLMLCRLSSPHCAQAAVEEIGDISRDDKQKRIRKKRGPNHRIRKSNCMKPPPLPPSLLAEDRLKAVRPLGPQPARPRTRTTVHQLPGA